MKNFGGSGEKVTLAGNGFGGTLAMILGGMSDSLGLDGTVQNVIAQSGSLMSSWAYSTNPNYDLEDLLEKAGCSSTSIANAIQCLRGLDALQLVTLAGNAASVFPFGIYVRNENPTPNDWKKSFHDLKFGFEGDDTIGSIQTSLFQKPVLIGVNGAAGYHFTVEAFPEIQTIFRRRRLSIDFIADMIDNDIYMENYQLSFSGNESRILKEFYIPWGVTDDGNEIKRSAVHYQTESAFTVPMYDDVTVRMNGETDTFIYVYQERTAERRARRWLNYGSDLGEEIPVLFPGTPEEERSILGPIMRKYWATFATRG